MRVSSPRPVRGKRSRTRRLYLSMSAAGVLISMLCLLLAICCLYHVAFCIIVVLFWVAQVNAAPMEALQMVLAHVRYTFILSVSMVGVLVPAAMAAMGLFSKKRHPDALCMYFLRGNLVCLVATVVAVAMLQQQLVELQTAWLLSSPKLELAFCVVSSLCVYVHCVSQATPRLRVAVSVRTLANKPQGHGILDHGGVRRMRIPPRWSAPMNPRAAGSGYGRSKQLVFAAMVVDGGLDAAQSVRQRSGPLSLSRCYSAALVLQ